MTRTTFLGLASLLIFVVGCDGPLHPTDVPGPPSPTDPTVVNLTISGPASLAPPNRGSSRGKFTATATFSDGQVRDVTAQAEWQVVPNPISGRTAVQLSGSSGEAQATARGESQIVARLNNKTASFAVMVLEEGTFKIGGRVYGSGERPLSASIVVQSGTGAGLRGDSNARGEYAIYGVAGPVVLALDAISYPRTTVPVEVTTNLAFDLAVEPIRLSADLWGRWLLTIEASASCRNWPLEARTRSYELSILQTLPLLTFTLIGPDVIDVARGKRGSYQAYARLVAPDTLALILGDPDYDSGHFLVDEISANQHIRIDGTVTAVAATSGFEGRMSGGLLYYQNSDAQHGTSCLAEDHRLIFRRP